MSNPCLLSKRLQESWSSRAPQARAGKPLHCLISQHWSPRPSAHLRALSAATEARHQHNLKQLDQGVMHLKSFLLQAEQGIPPCIILEKSLDTIAQVSGSETGTNATHFGLERMSLPITFACFKSHEPIRSSLKPPMYFTAMNHSLNTRAKTKVPTMNYCGNH